MTVPPPDPAGSAPGTGARTGSATDALRAPGPRSAATAPDPRSPATAPEPPPGCPASAYGPGGLIRLYGPEAENDPMGLYERLREQHGAVAPVLLQGDLPAWLVLGHRENLDVARTPSRFSRDSRHWRALREGRLTADHPLAPVAAWQPVCVFADGEEHERLRRAVTESIERFDRRGVRRQVTRFTHQLVDGFCSDGTADLVKQFAEHLPMLVMTQLLGMPDSYGPKLVNAARDMVKGTETAVTSNDHLVRTLRQLVSRKRAAPGPDFASWLIGHPAGLSDDEVEQHLRLVLITAYETTANLIANTLRMVLTDRRFRASLAGGHMTVPDAVEQVLWDEPPMMAILGRWATGDTELAGKPVKAGDVLVLGLAAGNLDPAIRPDPSVPIHGNRSHLAFSGGPHECPGQDIGRAIADSGIDALLSRLPDLRLAVPESELRWDCSLMTRHLTALPVEFARRRPERPEPAPVPRRVPVLPEPADVPETAHRPAPPAGTERSERWWRRMGRWLTGG